MADAEAKEEKQVVPDPAEATALALLVLLSGNVDPTEENINKLLDAAKASANQEKYTKTFAEAASKVELMDLVESYGKGGVGGGGAAAGGAADAGGAGGGAAAAAAPKEPTPEPESSVAPTGLGFGDDSSSDDSSSD